MLEKSSCLTFRVRIVPVLLYFSSKIETKEKKSLVSDREQLFSL